MIETTVVAHLIATHIGGAAAPDARAAAGCDAIIGGRGGRGGRAGGAGGAGFERQPQRGGLLWIPVRAANSLMGYARAIHLTLIADFFAGLILPAFLPGAGGPERAAN